MCCLNSISLKLFSTLALMRVNHPTRNSGLVLHAVSWSSIDDISFSLTNKCNSKLTVSLKETRLVSVAVFVARSCPTLYLHHCICLMLQLFYMQSFPCNILYKFSDMFLFAFILELALQFCFVFNTSCFYTLKLYLCD